MFFGAMTFKSAAIRIFLFGLETETTA